MKTNEFDDLLPNADELFRTTMRSNPTPEAQAWVKADDKVMSLEHRLGQYDAELRKRENGSQLVLLENDHTKALFEREKFLADHSKPMLIGRKAWDEQMDKHDDRVQSAQAKIEAWTAKCAPEEVGLLQARREAKYEQLTEAINERRALGKLPGEETNINEASDKRIQAMGQGADTFDLAARVQARRGANFAEGKDEQGQKMNANVWAARTMAGDDPEIQELAQVQKRLLMDLGRFPKEKEVDAALAKSRNPERGQSEFAEESASQRSGQRQR